MRSQRNRRPLSLMLLVLASFAPVGCTGGPAGSLVPQSLLPISTGDSNSPVPRLTGAEIPVPEPAPRDNWRPIANQDPAPAETIPNPNALGDEEPTPNPHAFWDDPLPGEDGNGTPPAPQFGTQELNEAMDDSVPGATADLGA